jgi:hypothetical protein
MAKTTKKAFAGITSKAPTKKTAPKKQAPVKGLATISGASTSTKKPYAMSHQEFIGNPTLQSGRTVKAKVDYKKAVKGGAAKTAKKLAPDEKTVLSVNTRSGSMFNSRSNVTEVASRAADRKAIAQRIINDKAKTSMRAKIIEMNAIKKANKKK